MCALNFGMRERMSKTMRTKGNGYWTKERCIEFAKQAKTSADVRRLSHTVYRKMRKNGWFDECDWLKVNNYKDKGYWDYEHCYEAALNCFNRKTFKKYYPAAYETARKNGWIADYSWFPPKKVWKESNYLVYAYEDTDNNVVYVGLTHDFYNRHRAHKLGFVYRGKTTYDSVYKHFNSIGKEVPEPRILISGLSAEQAQYYEDWYRNSYETICWTVLNVRPTGIGKSSLGGSTLKWDREACEKEARKYRTKAEFKRGCISAYQNAVKYDWIDTYDWFEEVTKPMGYWTYDRVAEVAKKYNSKKEFRENAKAAYSAAYKKGWLYDFFPMERKPTGYWTKERVLEEAKKYETRNEFYKKSCGAYGAARKNNWLDELCFKEVRKPAGYWTKDRVIEEATKYKTKKGLMRGSNGAYKAAKRNGWFEFLTYKVA